MTRKKVAIQISFLAALCIWTARPQEAGLPTFTDITEAAGVHFKHSFGDYEMDNIVEAAGSGACVFDYNGDGLMDIYFLNGRWQKGVNDNRGRDLRDKLFNALYRNNGDGTFTEVAGEAGVLGKGMAFGASAEDFDGDGDLDLYVLNYGPNEFFRNNGDGTFTDISEQSGLADPRWSLSAAWLDYNNDGLLDVYVCNYLEYDEGKFRAFYAAAGHSGPLSYHGQPDALYRNNGNGTFTDVTREAGLFNSEGRGMSVMAADLNNDGYLDLFVANGHALHEFTQEDLLLRNNGRSPLEFIDVSVNSGPYFQEKHVGRGVAYGDLDDDGDIDLVICNLNDQAKVLRNDGGNRNNWLKVSVKKSNGKSDAIGARVTAQVGSVRQIEDVVAVEGYLSQSDVRVHFGVGRATKVDLLEIRWPGGRVQHFRDVKPNQILKVVENAH